MTNRNLHRRASDPDYGHSEPMWRMAWLVTVVKRDFGAAYHPEARADLDANIKRPFTDAREVFIHGLLSYDPKRRWGTCASIPVLITAVGRRLGHPIRLAVAGSHVYVRWDDGNGTQFNIEASNAMGMTSEPDEHFRHWPEESTPEDERIGFYRRSLSAMEEFGLFMKLRAWCLFDAARYDEIFFWCARSLQFSPDEPRFPQMAWKMMDQSLKHRHWKKYSDRKIPAPEQQFDFQVGELLRMEELPLFMTIQAHRYESDGKLDEAREHYEDACRCNSCGVNEHRDLKRFLRKNGLRNAPKRSLSSNHQRLRRFRLNCKPFEERGTLRRLADQFERNGELVKARDTLHDLYLFDPADTEIFQRARYIEQQPYFQVQFKALYEARKRKLKVRAASRITTPHGMIISGTALMNEKE